MVIKRKVKTGEQVKEERLAAKAQAEEIAEKEKERDSSDEEEDEPAKKTPVAPRKVTEAQRQELTQQAIEAIKAELKEHPDAQKNGNPVLLKNWAVTYKPVLGPYRRFVEKCSAFYIKTGELASEYTIHVQKEKIAKATPDRKEWQLKLVKAWEEYQQNVKKEDHDPDEFVAVASQLAVLRPGWGDNRAARRKRKRHAIQLEKAAAAGGAEGQPEKKKAKGEDGEAKSAPSEEKNAPSEEQGKLKKKKKKAAA